VLYTKSILENLGRFKKRIQIGSVSLTAARTALYLFLTGLLFLPLFAKNYLLDISILTGIYAILALGLNIVVGFTGLLNLGFVAFYAIGAYAYALLNVKIGLGFWQSLPLCVCVTSLSGFLLAVPALRLKGDYLAIVTLGFGEIVRLVLNNWDSLTNGPNGVSGISSPYLFGSPLGGLNRYYYLVLLSVTVTYAVVSRVRSSKIGRAWIAIREDEICASTMGINTTMYKLYAVTFGSFWAGLAGSLFAAKMQFVSPESFTFMESVLILCMVILGGLGSLPGVVIGALILVMLPEVLREVQSYRMLALGAGLIVMMIFKPQGILGGMGIEKEVRDTRT
jgi:branched-chain amino acid transport system permease protein